MLSPSCALLIDKPVDLTSSDVVTRLKWRLIKSGYAEKGFRIGHGGTLDPFATGILVVLIGEATKLADTYLHSFKSYEGLITLGAETPTGDSTQEPSNRASVPDLSEEDWQALARSFANESYLQIPPMYSAKKRDGVALHDLARAGITIEREAILKKIHSFSVKKTAHENPTLFFQVQCEGGTYVRVLAEDLAKKAHTLAHLKTLRRTQASDVQINECATLEETLEKLDGPTPLTRLRNYRPLAGLSHHVNALEIDQNSSELLWRGNTGETDRLCRICQDLYPGASFVLARNHVPVALFASLSDVDGFRLQRIFNAARE